MDETALTEQMAVRLQRMDVAKDEAYVAGIDLLLSLEARYMERFKQRATPRMLQDVLVVNRKLTALLSELE